MNPWDFKKQPIYVHCCCLFFLFSRLNCIWILRHNWLRHLSFSLNFNLAVWWHNYFGEPFDLLLPLVTTSIYFCLEYSLLNFDILFWWFCVTNVKIYSNYIFTLMVILLISCIFRKFIDFLFIVHLWNVNFTSQSMTHYVIYYMLL